MILIRYANKNDATTIARFNSALAMETEGKELHSDTVKAGVEKALDNNNHGFYLLAESAGSPVGQLMITKEWSDWRNGEFWWVQSVYIHPNFRGQGIYKRLYQEVKDMANSDGNVCGIRLYVERHNKTAQKVYTKLGMKETNYSLYEKDWSSE